MHSHHILITGGSGLIGRELTKALLNKGYQVSHLSRTPRNIGKVKTYKWDINKALIDPNCINGVDTIIHLAGAGIAQKRWTERRKQELINSRTRSIHLIYELLKDVPNTVKHIISASATGYYSNRGNEILTEESAPAHDFLGTCCLEWEKAVDEGKELGLTISKFRTGVVLSKAGGALPQLALPVKFGVGAPLGNGKQFIPWIHIDDVVEIYLQAVENKLPPDVYNMVAPHPVTNSELTQAVAVQLHKLLWLPPIPAFVLKLFFGEMSLVVLGSTCALPRKLQRAGFAFQFPAVTDALRDIYEQ